MVAANSLAALVGLSSGGGGGGGCGSPLDELTTKLDASERTELTHLLIEIAKLPAGVRAAQLRNLTELTRNLITSSSGLGHAGGAVFGSAGVNAGGTVS